MKRNRSFCQLFLLSFLVIVITIITFSIISVEARKNNHRQNMINKRLPKRHTRGRATSPSPSPSPSPPLSTNTFDIMSFGAKGNGISDDSQALVVAWRSACKVGGATVLVPSKLKFLLKPLTLQGPCMPDLTLQIDGTLVAPEEASSWPKSSLYQWINFKWLQNFTLKGSGTLDGQGSNWWTTSSSSEPYNYETQKSYSKHIPYMKPTNTHDVQIQHSDIQTGDDCVSIQTGCSKVHVHHIMCGPGHGISLGGLGKDKSVACVSDIIVEDISMKNTLYGARIKTWQGGNGMVKNVRFSRIQLYDVMYPIMIDQYYCDKHACKNETEAVVISGVKFNQISGTYGVQPIHLACSNSLPCTDVDLIDIQLRPSIKYQGLLQQAVCWNSYGTSQGPLLPSSIHYCLRSGGGSIKRIARSHDTLCY
ncbi:polygalacturonase At1g48100 isoform X2 [Arachis hypogaea]|uniref:polygalacturonase At1g48100 isoform X2 n=1 Tax=Arachis hypogaea TaxID=3818 RepID=UPI003B215E8C